MSSIINGIAKDLKAVPKMLKEKAGGIDVKRVLLLNLPYIGVGYFCDKVAWLWRVAGGINTSDRMIEVMNGLDTLFSNPLPSLHPKDLLIGTGCRIALWLAVYFKAKNAKKFRHGVEYGSARCGGKWESFMSCTEAYREHIMYMFDGFCKTVIRYSALNAWRDRSRRWQKEISLEYLTEEKILPFRHNRRIF